MKLRSFIFHMLIVLSFPICCHALEPNDFAYGMTINTPGDAAAYRLMTPEAVYRNIARNNLGDLRIFNTEGDPVPHTIRLSHKTHTENPPAISIPFFPVQDDMTGSGDDRGMSVNIHRTADGSLYIESTPITSQTNPRIYVLDASQLDHPSSRLVFNWTLTDNEERGFLHHVTVYGSMDLNRWETLVSRATLASILYGEHELIKRFIDLKVHRAKYYRIVIQDADPSLLISEVSAEFPETRSENERRTITLQPKAVSDDHLSYEFDTEGRFPVDTVHIRLPYANSMTSGVLKSRTSEKEEWKPVLNDIFYRLNIEGTELENEARKIRDSFNRHYRLEIGGNGTIFRSRPPTLEIGYPPHEILFLAQGGSPYTLAFGSAVGTLPEPRHSEILSQVAREKPVQTQGEPFLLGGLSRLIPKPSTELWKVRVLWSTLILVVILLALTAYRLYRRISAENAEKS